MLSPIILQSIAKWALLCILFTPTYSYSQESILAVMSNEKRIYNDFYLTLKNKLQDDITITKITTSEISTETLSKHNYIITIGYDAAKKISKHKPKTTVIYSLIPDNKQLHASLYCENKKCYYVYINQPVVRYTKLFKLIFPKNKTMVLATTRANTKISQQLKIASKNTGITYKEIQFKKNDNIARNFINKLSPDDVLLALPNSDIYNSYNAKSILLSTYHKNIPIIAYSKSFVKAGAVAGIYSSVDHVADKTATTVKDILKNGHKKQKEYHPDDFTVEINSAVARSLNMNFDSEIEIKRKIK